MQHRCLPTALGRHLKAVGSYINNTVPGMHEYTLCDQEERKRVCISFFLFFPLSLTLELTSAMEQIVVISTVSHLALPSWRTMTTWVLFVMVSLSGVYNMTFSLTICLLSISSGILARVGQEHTSRKKHAGKNAFKAVSHSEHDPARMLKETKNALKEPTESLIPRLLDLFQIKTLFCHTSSGSSWTIWKIQLQWRSWFPGSFITRVEVPFTLAVKKNRAIGNSLQNIYLMESKIKTD